MEEKTDGKRTTPPSIPANYVSILQLQERWNNERARKRKEEEEEERRRKLQVEEELKKAKDVGGKRDEEEKRFDRSNWKNWGRSISKEKESLNGGEVRCGEKEEPAVTATIGSGGGEDTAVTSNEGLLPKKMSGFRRKRYDSKKKKKKTEDVAVVEDIVVDDGCRSIVATESNTPVMDEILVYRKKGEISTGEKSVGSREKAVTAIETQFEDLSIKRSIYRNQRVKMPIGAASKMVWVKKEQNERAIDRIAMMP